MSTSIRALRGATTFEVDEAEHVSARVVELVSEMLDRNNGEKRDVIGDGEIQVRRQHPTQ